jgi:hypothetical protein
VIACCVHRHGTRPGECRSRILGIEAGASRCDCQICAADFQPLLRKLEVDQACCADDAAVEKDRETVPVLVGQHLIKAGIEACAAPIGWIDLPDRIRRVAHDTQPFSVRFNRGIKGDGATDPLPVF